MVHKAAIIDYFHKLTFVKKSFFRFLLAVGVFLFSFTNHAKSQVSYDLVVGGDPVDQLIELTNTGSTISKPIIVIKLASGVHIQGSGSINPSSGLSNGTTFSFVGGSTNEFKLELSGDFPSNSTMQIRFARVATCSAVLGTTYKDVATIDLGGGSKLIADSDYAIWEPLLNPESITSSSFPNVIAGRSILFTAKIKNTGQLSYTSSFNINITHEDLETPKNITLEMDGIELVVSADKITTASNITSITITPDMLMLLGKTDGRFAYYPNAMQVRQDEMLVKFTAVPTIERCGNFVEVKVSTVNCGKEITNPAGSVNMNVQSPGFTRSTFEVERRNYDFPDALDNGTVNGTWASAVPERNLVRNGDTLGLTVTGLITTSSLIPEVRQLNASFGFSDNKHNEFTWLSEVKVKIKEYGSSSWNDYLIMADVQVTSTEVGYKIATPGNIPLNDGDEVQLIITAVMKKDASTPGLCNVGLELFALETHESIAPYPPAACRSVSVEFLHKVVVKDTFVIPFTITGSCAPVLSTAIFKSTAYTFPGVTCTNCFTEEFRSNSYIRELLVYVPAEGKISSGSIVIAGTTFTYASSDIPAATTVSYTDGTLTYSDAKCYTFFLEDKYGAYGNNSSLFVDELEHEVTANFSVIFESPVNKGAQTMSIMYVATPVNPSMPSINLQPLSALQKVTLPAIAPLVTVANPPGRDVEITPATGEVTWYLSVANNVAGAAALDNLSLQIEDLTGGSFANLTVTQTGQPTKLVIGGSVSLATIPSGAIHILEIKGIVDNACNNIERIKAILIHEPCGGQGIRLAEEELVYRAPASAIQVSSTLSTTNLTMCDEFEVTMVISALRGTVKDPIAKLALPKNSANLTGLDFVGVRKAGDLFDYPYIGDLEVLTFDLNAIAGVNQLAAGQDVTLKVRLKPNCNFPINSRLISYAYGKNFCDSYNSEGSGSPVRTNYLTIDGLQSSYTAQVTFSESSLTFDKSTAHKQKTTKLTIKKLTGGSIGANDVISISMPKSLRVEIDGVDTNVSGNSLGAVVSTSGSGIDEQRVVTWPAPASISTSEKEYSLVFVMDNPAAYNDLLNGTITAIIINKVQGLPCGLGTCPSIETKAGEGATTFRIVDLFPALAKDVSYTASSLMSYSFTYTFTLKNYGDLTINNLRLEDDLSDFYSKGTVSGISLLSSASSLICNTAYNGDTDIHLLAAGSSLLPNETQTVTLSVHVVFNEEWRNKKFTIANTALVIGSNENGTDYEDSSNNGTNPDLTDDTPTTTDPIDTNPPIVIIEPVIDTPPPGFAITANGVECFEGNEGTTTPLEFKFKLKDGKPLDYDLCFTVYTRDSIATVKDNDYIRVMPTVVCIYAGKVRSDNSIITTIVGDDKFEKDEPFILDVKPTINPMTCDPLVITILNDDAQPSVIIDDIVLDDDKGVIPNLGDLSHLEGTSTTARTKFSYCVILNVAAPQDLVLRVVVGNDNDTAVQGKDYYVNGDIVVAIPAGQDRGCFEIDVEPDDIPENDEVFTMSFSLEAGGVAFYEEVKRTVIIDDDEFKVPSSLNDVLVYCEGDDAVTQAQKLKNFITVDSRYELRWYSSPTSAVQISEPLVDATVKGATYTFWLGYYDPEENYEAPVNKRSEITIRIQDAPQLLIVSTPASPMELKPGQSAVFTATSGLASYDFILNGSSLTPNVVSTNEVQVHRDMLISQNVVEVNVIDYAGCPWTQSIAVDVSQTELPNAFIPEGSNTENQKYLEGYDLRIFNRWGHLLYQGKEGWDGRYKGSYVAPGTYYYVVNIRQQDGTVVEEKGSVTVVSAAKK